MRPSVHVLRRPAIVVMTQPLYMADRVTVASAWSACSGSERAAMSP